MIRPLDLLRSAAADISVGDVYSDENGKVKVKVIAISPEGDVIWHDDGMMHLVMPSRDRLDFYRMVSVMHRER